MVNLAFMGGITYHSIQLKLKRRYNLRQVKLAQIRRQEEANRKIREAREQDLKRSNFILSLFNSQEASE